MPAQPLVRQLTLVAVVPGDFHRLALRVAGDRHRRDAFEGLFAAHRGGIYRALPSAKLSARMNDFYKKVEDIIKQGETVAVATIVNARGSVPREVGAKMLIRRSGEFDGTVGGGCGEADVFRAAVDVIETKQPQMVHVDLTDEIAMRTEAVCGGHMDIFVEPWFLPEK